MDSRSVLGLGGQAGKAYHSVMMDMTTTQSLDIFLRALEGQNYSPKTLRAYGGLYYQ